MVGFEMMPRVEEKKPSEGFAMTEMKLLMTWSLF